MDQIMKYMDRHQDHIANVFVSMGKNQTIEATKVFNFIQNSFNQQSFTFSLHGKDFFADDDNAGNMEKLIESYYRQTSEDEDKKFYLYRIQFTLLEIKYILEFWLNREPNLKIVYKQGYKKEVEKEKGNEEQEQDNQFDIDNDKIPQMIKECQQQIKKYEQVLSKEGKDEQETKKIIKSVEDLNYRIKVLEHRLKANENKPQKNTEQSQDIDQRKNTKSKSPKKQIKIDYPAIFQFYARQNHLAGVKSTFDRIQHETQSINYQKLVHFLRQFSLMPTKTGLHKKVHILYVKNCDKTRDLSLPGFKKVLTGVSELIFENKTAQQREQLLKEKLLQKKIKGLKLLNNPFHSLQKEDFRINVDELTYNFRLKPQDGKFVKEVVETLEMRRKLKQEQKQEKEKIRKQKKIKQLKRLQAIDPFDPQVLKNSVLLEQKQQVQPIASLDNIEKYRDKSFDFESLFGVKKNQNRKTPRSFSVKLDESVQNGGYRQETLKKVSKLERYEMDKMSNLMNGIIERSNAKMHKLGISPKKSIKFN